MKKIFVLLFLFISLSMQSQVLITLLLGDKLNSDGLEFGLEGGINLTKIDGLETSRLAGKWNLGFYFDIRLKKQWFLYTGVLVKSNFGVDLLTDNDLNKIGATIYYTDDDETIKAEGDYSQKINAFMVPVLAKYKFKNNMYFELGPQLSLMYRSWVQFDSEIEDREAIIKEYNKDAINRIDAGIMVGAGFTLFKGTGWTFGAKYYYGFTDVYKNVSGTNNSSIYFKVNIPVGAGKAKEKREKEKQLND